MKDRILLAFGGLFLGLFFGTEWRIAYEHVTGMRVPEYVDEFNVTQHLKENPKEVQDGAFGYGWIGDRCMRICDVPKDWSLQFESSAEIHRENEINQTSSGSDCAANIAAVGGSVSVNCGNSKK